MQLVLMALQPGEKIGDEVHRDRDEFFRVEKGKGEAWIDGHKPEIKSDMAIVVLAGARYDTKNTGEKSLKLYTLYAPPEHGDGTVQVAKADAQASKAHFDGKTTEYQRGSWLGNTRLTVTFDNSIRQPMGTASARKHGSEYWKSVDAVKNKSVTTVEKFSRRIRIFLSHDRIACLVTVACFLFINFLLCSPTSAQLTAPASASTTAQPEVPKDSLGRTTPRGTVLGFLTAARDGNDELAVQYLNTRLKGKAAADLAHQLFAVLDRGLPARLHHISDQPEGSLSNQPKPDQKFVGTISGDNGNVDILLERVDRENSGYLWLFSRKTLAAIPNLYEEINAVSVDSVLPDFLVNTRFAGIVLFEWLAVFVGIPLFYFLTVLLNRLLSPLIGLLRRRLYRKPNLPNPEFLPNPVRLLILALAIHWITPKFKLPLLARQFWSTTSIIITIVGCVWLLILFTSWGEDYVRRLLRIRHRVGATSILRLARWAVDLLIVFVGILVTLHYFGVNPTAALAGLGVGGIALAFGAQKTLENVIGGISLIFDQAVRVGDNLRVGDTQGTVDDIGLRSTRIRTLDRTVVSVPNGQIANMTLENQSSRDKFWFHPILALRYGTTSSQMKSVLDHIRSLLKESLYVESDSVRVRFLRLGPSSLDVEVFAYVLTRDWNQFLEIQEGLLLRIMECIESAGVQIAVPLQAMMAAVSTSNDAAGRALIKAPTPEKKPGDDAAVAKSA